MLLTGGVFSYFVLSCLDQRLIPFPKFLEYLLALPLVLAMCGILMLLTGRSLLALKRDFAAGSPLVVAAMLVMAGLVAVGIPVALWNLGPPRTLPQLPQKQWMDLIQSPQASAPIHILHLHPLQQPTPADRTNAPNAAPTDPSAERMDDRDAARSSAAPP